MSISLTSGKALTLRKSPSLHRNARGAGVCARMLLATPLVPLTDGIEPYPMPVRVRRMLQVTGEIRELFDLRGQYGRLDIEMFAVRYRAEHLRVPTALGDGG